MITAETKTFSIFAVGACLLLLAAVVGMLYVIQQKKTEYEAQYHARAIRIAQETQAASLDELIAETADDRAQLARYMLTEDSVVDFLSHIERLAEVSGVTTKTRSLAVEAIEKDQVFERLTFEVDTNGPFASVRQMLSLLESLPYQVQVRVVNIERIGQTEAGALWRGSYRVYVTKYK